MGKRVKQWRTGTFLIGIASILSSQSVTSVPHDSSSVKRILVLGDSWSKGFGLKSSQAYPALLTEKLRAANLNFEITNASQSGGTTEGGQAPFSPPPHNKNKIFFFSLPGATR